MDAGLAERGNSDGNVQSTFGAVYSFVWEILFRKETRPGACQTWTAELEENLFQKADDITGDTPGAEVPRALR